MTLLIGVLCEDGAVLGADSAATLGALGNSTISQPVASNIEVIDGRALMGVSGPLGLGQRLKGEFAARIRKILPADSWKAMTELREIFQHHLESELRAAAAAAPVVGPQIAAASALSHSVVAVPVGGRVALFEFDQQGAPEEHTADLPFGCAGSGQPNADPFMAFMRDVFGQTGCPTSRRPSSPSLGRSTSASRSHPEVSAGRSICTGSAATGSATWPRRSMMLNCRSTDSLWEGRARPSGASKN